MSFIFKSRTHVQCEDLEVSGYFWGGSVGERKMQGAKQMTVGQDDETKGLA